MSEGNFVPPASIVQFNMRKDLELLCKQLLKKKNEQQQNLLWPK